MIDDDKLIETFNAIKDSGHPDPIGFIARGKVKTGLSYDGEYKGAVGTFGISRNQAIHAGYEDEDILSTDGNAIAGVEVDLNNLRKADDDINKMFELSNDGGKKSTTRFMKRLDKERTYLKERMVFDDNGNLVKIKKSKKDDELNISNEIKFNKDGGIKSATTTDKRDNKTNRKRVLVSSDNKRVIYSNSNSTETADDIIKQTKEYVFRSEDKKKIDEMLQHLVGIIIDEKPLSSIR